MSDMKRGSTYPIVLSFEGIELWRAPMDVANHGGWEQQQNMLHLIDCWNNGGTLT